ncbi:hypothetical protein C8Q76DRAFT_697935 [Earliella scabrosa]|nr:hypothetical protein C8Q76DRAFT_697935 [Earliella scabrosa]
MTGTRPPTTIAMSLIGSPEQTIFVQHPAEPLPQVQWSARLEILLSVWRIAQAFRALPQSPTELIWRRWGHGIARELWIAISATGLDSCTTVALREPQTRRCGALVLLLRHLEWRANRSLKFDASTFNVGGFFEKIGNLADNPDLASMDLVWSHAKWWTWPDAGPNEGTPVWWVDPSAFVPHPMPLHSSDLQGFRYHATAVRSELSDILEGHKVAVEQLNTRIRDLEHELFE